MATYFQGALKLGTTPSETSTASYVTSVQTGTVSSAGAGTGAANFDLTFTLPVGAKILSIVADSTAAWAPSGTASLTIGTTAGGTEYVTGFDVKTVTRGPTAAFTAAQLGAMNSVAASGAVVVRVAVSAATSGGYAGNTVVAITYAQLT